MRAVQIRRASASRELALELEVHHRLAVRGVAPGHHALEAAVLAPRRADHRVQEAAERELARRELLGDRVHQEGRVVGVGLDHGAHGRRSRRARSSG